MSINELTQKQKTRNRLIDCMTDTNIPIYFKLKSINIYTYYEVLEKLSVINSPIVSLIRSRR